MNISRIIIKKILNEDVTGDKASATVAKGKDIVAGVKERMRKFVYDIPELKGVYTVEQLSIEPFKFTFLLQVQDNQEELTIPKPITFNTLGRVIESPDKKLPDGTLTIELKTLGDVEIVMNPERTVKIPAQSIFILNIRKNELVTKLPGTKKDISALKEDSFYTALFAMDFFKFFFVKNEETEKTDETDKEEVDKEGKDKKLNYYNGKDLKEVNQKLSDTKDKAKWFSITKQYKNDQEFLDLFLDAIIDSTKSIKINQKPLYVTLKELRSNGILEAPESMSGRKRNYLKYKLNLQNFMVDVFSLFAKMSKNGKNSKTYEVIKNFYKQLFLIASKGRTSISDQKTRKQLVKKLLGDFSNFLGEITRLPEMVKGKGGEKPQGKEIKAKTTPKATMSTVESYFYLNNFLFEEDGETGENTGEQNTEKKPVKDIIDTGRITSKIYIKKIELGPKGAAKRGEDVDSYTEKVKGGESSKWDGYVTSLPDDGLQLNVNLELNDDNLDSEQQKVFNTLAGILKGASYNGAAIVRKSKKTNNVFIIEFNRKAFVCEVAQGANLKKVTDIEIGPKAAGEDIFTESIKAKIQIS